MFTAPFKGSSSRISRKTKINGSSKNRKTMCLGYEQANLACAHRDLNALSKNMCLHASMHISSLVMAHVAPESVIFLELFYASLLFHIQKMLFACFACSHSLTQDEACSDLPSHQGRCLQKGACLVRGARQQSVLTL